MEIKLLKLLTLFFILFVPLTQASLYKNNCINCHKKIPVNIDKYFYRYLLKYSSEEQVKSAIKKYLQNPTKETTVMPNAFINRFGIKEKSKLSNEQLDNAINEYWKTYKVSNKLK